MSAYQRLVRLLQHGPSANSALAAHSPGELPWAPAPAHPATSGISFNELLHALRGAELSRMPRSGGTMRSAGCADRYYFDWIEGQYGRLDRHIGLELYLPQPDDLPAYVRWIKSSVSSMDGVRDGEVQLVYSGQNFEHLFDHDALGFLLESRRVLAPDGWLVIDSPNRSVTTRVDWTMPEHTIEFVPSEAADLVTLAGFDVRSLRGVWLCKDRNGRSLGYWPDASAPAIEEVLERSVLAADRPEDSFIWWLEAQRAHRPADVDGLREHFDQIFEVAWRDRLGQLRLGVGQLCDDPRGEFVSVPAGVRGYAIYGPYVPLTAGDYTVTYELAADRSPVPDSSAPAATLDVCDVEGTVVASRKVEAAQLTSDGWQRFDLPFHLSNLIWGAQFRVHSDGAATLKVRRRVELH